MKDQISTFRSWGRWTVRSLRQCRQRAATALWWRQNLKYLLLALPGILMPDCTGLCGCGSIGFTVGVPALAAMGVRVESGFIRITHFELRDLFFLTMLTIGWSCLVWFGCFLRRMAGQRGDWFGATIQASLMGMYMFLWFFFLVGVMRLLPLVCWYSPDSVAGFLVLTSKTYPIACVIVTLVPLAGIWVDSRRWRGSLRTPYVGIALLSLGLLAYTDRSVPLVMRWLEYRSQVETAGDDVTNKALESIDQGTR